MYAIMFIIHRLYQTAPSLEKSAGYPMSLPALSKSLAVFIFSLKSIPKGYSRGLRLRCVKDKMDYGLKPSLGRWICCHGE